MDIEKLYGKYTECGCRVTTDSRKICGGEIFFALKGENFDGNDYAFRALEAGAAYAVVDSPALPDDPRLIRVEDAFAALQALAVHHRTHVCDGALAVLGLTGTNGKTTTKNLISLVLGAKYRVVSTRGNLNNDIGVPLSLLSIRPDTQIAVIEMGASHPDDIEKLVQVCRPDYGLITNVGKAHLQGFGSFEGVLDAKTALYRYLGSHRGSLIFLNEDDAVLKARAALEPCHCYGYGRRYQGVEILPVSTAEPFLRLALDGKTVRTRLIGSYNADNVLAAIAVGDYFGVPRDAAIAAIESFEPGNQRSQLVKTQRNTLIVDAYNANPSSMAAAIENFAGAAAERRLALLGEMRELGADSLREHARVLRTLRSLGIPAALVGEQFRLALEEEGCAYTVADSDGDISAVRDTSAARAVSSTRSSGTDTAACGSGTGMAALGSGTGMAAGGDAPDSACSRRCPAAAGEPFLWAESSAVLASYLSARPVSGALVLIKGSRGIEMEKVIPSL